MTKTATLALETTAEPQAVWRIVSEPKRLPEWASAFTDTAERQADGRWRLSKHGQAFVVRVVTHAPSRAIDFLRPLPSGGEGGAYVRVVDRPGGGSVVIMTAPDPAGGAARILEEELSALIRLAEATSLA